MSKPSVWQRALGAFHSGMRTGTGATETISAGTPPADRRRAPYYAALAAAGLGGMVLAADVSHAMAAGAGHAASPSAVAQALEGGDVASARFIDGLFETRTRMTSAPTVSPRLRAMQEDFTEFASDADLLIVDVRNMSPDFGKGVPADLLKVYVEKWGQVSPEATAFNKASVPGLKLGADDGTRPFACVVTVGGAALSGTAYEKAAAVAGVATRSATGHLATMEDGRVAAQHGRMEVDLNDRGFDNFVTYHEFGHCADPNMRLSKISGMDGHQKAYHLHKAENFADVFASIMTARLEGHTRTAEAFADLRMLGVATNGGHGMLATRLASGEIADSTGARYYTSPSIDATVRWVDAVGIEAVRDMSPAEVVAKAREITEAHTMSFADWNRMKVGLTDIRYHDGRFVVAPGMPGELVGRLDKAMGRTGFKPTSGDAPGLAQSRPAYEAAAKAPAPAARMSMASVGGIDFGKLLAQDISEGATVVRIEPKGSGTKVYLREADGSGSSAIVSAEGDLMRYRADGKLSSLSEDRPALVSADGKPTHLLIIDGNLTTLDADQAREVFVSQRHAAPAR